MKNSFKVITPEGEEVVCDILFTFDSEETGKSYIVYTDNTLDANGKINVLASIYDPTQVSRKLEPIETEEEWRIIENILSVVQEEARRGTGTKTEILKAEPGDELIFGAWGDYAFQEGRQPLIWQVVERRGDELLVAAAQFLEERPFDLAGQQNCWEKSELHDWLNTTFLIEAFSTSEREAVISLNESEVSAAEKDFVTIPSRAQWEQWQISGKFRGVKRTLKNCLAEDTFQGFWLRDSTGFSRVDCQRPDGTSGARMPDERLSVLPVMWLDLKKLPEIAVSKTLDEPVQGVLVGDKYFYAKGYYVNLFTDKDTGFLYVKHTEDTVYLAGKSYLGKNLVFPAELDGFKVVGILGEYRSPAVTSIVIEEGIEFLGDGAIVLCENLTSVQLPSTLKAFAGSNFAGCSELEDMAVPENNPWITNYQDVIFTKDLHTLIKYLPMRDTNGVYRIPESVASVSPGAFCDADLLEISFQGEFRAFTPYAFAFADTDEFYISGTQESHLPITIGPHAFENCYVKKLRLPDWVERIEDAAFANCPRLHRLFLPKTLEYLGKDVFRGCNVLVSVRLPEGITALEGTFAGCRCLKQVYIPESVTMADSEVFALNADVQTKRPADIDGMDALTIFGQEGSFIEGWTKAQGLHFSHAPFDERICFKDTIYRSVPEDYKNAGAGDVITFGSYTMRMTGDRKDPVEWIVLQNDGKKLLVMSRIGLTEQGYEDMETWLHTFSAEAFSESEMGCIFYDKSRNGKVFCLSREEVLTWMPEPKSRRTCRSDVKYCRDGWHREARWWLCETVCADVNTKEIVEKDGTFSSVPEDFACSVRPAMWLDLEALAQWMPQNNETYIKSWFLENNDMLALGEDGGKLLELFTMMTIICEKISGINEVDEIIKYKDTFRIVSGPAIKNNTVSYILRLLNHYYGCFNYDAVADEIGIENYLKWEDEDGTDDTLEWFWSYFGDCFEKLMERHDESEFCRIPYLINEMVFYAAQPLTDDEIAVIQKKTVPYTESPGQKRFYAEHTEGGRIFWW